MPSFRNCPPPQRLLPSDTLAFLRIRTPTIEGRIRTFVSLGQNARRSRRCVPSFRTTVPKRSAPCSKKFRSPETDCRSNELLAISQGQVCVGLNPNAPRRNRPEQTQPGAAQEQRRPADDEGKADAAIARRFTQQTPKQNGFAASSSSRPVRKMSEATIARTASFSRIGKLAIKNIRTLDEKIAAFPSPPGNAHKRQRTGGWNGSTVTVCSFVGIGRRAARRCA